MKQQTLNFDIVIIGSGMVGATLACALAEQKLRIAVVDQSSALTSWNAADYDLRVSAITRASQHIFENIGVWDSIVAKRVSPYQHMHVWDATGNGVIHFDCADIGEANLGHIIENSAIQASLHEKLSQTANCTLINGVHCQQILFDDQAILTLDNQQTLRTKLVVGADGARSWLRSALDIQTTGWSYQQKGVVTTVRTSAGNARTAWQRFLPTGPLAFLPLKDDYCSIVWSTTETEADQLVGLSDTEFLQALNHALGDSPLGEVVESGKRAAFPLRLQHANQYTKARALLIGDAAHTVHPLAGQGVNLGLQDVATLADLLFNAIANKRDFGSHQLLRRYERERKAENLLMLGTMDGFKRLFSNKTPSLSWLRNTGLNITNRLTPIKNSLIRQAMGITGKQPDLAKRIYD